MLTGKLRLPDPRFLVEPAVHTCARAAHPRVAAHRVWMREQSWRDRRTAAPRGEPCEASS